MESDRGTLLPGRWGNRLKDFSNSNRFIVHISRDAPEIPGQPHTIRIIPQRYSPSKAEQIFLEFASRVRSSGIVIEVRYTQDEERITAWTITDGPPFEFESNKPIYEAAIDAMSLQEEPVFDFRVININELEEGGSIDDIVPRGAKTIWKRQYAS